jgi:uncharacterized protein (DUF433 family)
VAKKATPMKSPDLEVELFAVREAARLLRLQTITLKRWLEGGNVSGRTYPPVIRVEPTGSDVVTWGEFVEAGLLREYRIRDIPLQRMRPFIDELRADFGVRYPLAKFRPLVDNKAREAVLKAQKVAGLKENQLLIRRVGKSKKRGAWQVQWGEPVRDFLEKVEFDAEGTVLRWFPIGRKHLVVIDPAVQFGIPHVKGIRTEAIAESYAELGAEDEVARDWGIPIANVRAALKWELNTGHRAA